MKRDAAMVRLAHDHPGTCLHLTTRISAARVAHLRCADGMS